MAAPVQSPNQFDVARRRFRQKLDQIRNRVEADSITSQDEVYLEVLVAYRELYDKIQDPENVYLPLDEFDVRDEDVLSAPFAAASRNATFLSQIHDRLQRVQRNSFNYLTALSDAADGRIRRGAAKSADLRILTSKMDTGLLVAGDDFGDATRIDRTATGTVVVELDPLGGAITLRRTGSVDVIEQATPAVHIEGPAQLYEGKKFGTLEPSVNAEPEGNAFRFVESAGAFQQNRVEGLSRELESRFQALAAFFEANPTQRQELGVQGPLTANLGLQRARASGTFAGLSIDEWEQIAGNYHYENTFVDAAPPISDFFGGKKDSSQRESVREVNDSSKRLLISRSPPEEVAEKRLRLLDNDPETFWQAEMVVDTTEEYNRIRFDEESNEPIPEVDFETLVQQVQDQFDPAGRDLDISIVVDLGSPQDINFLTILPVHFHSTQVPEVTGISWSLDGGEFTPIPEATNGTFEQKLVQDVNAELRDDEVALSLSANKFAMSGQGLFSFDRIRAQFVRVSMKERVPAPLLYHVMRVILQRTVTVKKKKKRFGRTKRRTQVTHYSRTLDLDYANTLQMILDEVDREEALAPGGPTSSTDRFVSLSGAGLAAGNIAIAAVSGIFGKRSGFARGFAKGAGFGSSIKTYDTGWEVKKTTLVPRRDKARYAIGIRELRLFAYSYEEASELVSTPFFTPKPIDTITLEVDEVIPRSLSGEDFLAIRYFVSVDDGATWGEISPLGSKLRARGGDHVPQIFQVNSGIPSTERDLNLGFLDTTEEARQVRFRAVLSRQNDENVTPVLKGYRLKIRVKGGL